MERTRRVLACTSAAAERRLRIALEGCELTMALTLAEALEALAKTRYDLLIIGMLFDESRALELMHAVRADSALADLPVVGIRGAKFVRAIKPEVFDVPMIALGAADLIDFGAIPDDEVGNRLIGRRLRACLRAP